MEFQILDIRTRYQEYPSLRTFIRLIGRNSAGERVVADVFGVPWYVYVDQWEHPSWTFDVNDKMAKSLEYAKKCKCVKCAGAKEGRNEPCKFKQKALLDTFIIDVETVRKKSFVGYSPSPRPFYKLVLSQAFLMRPVTWAADRMLEDDDIKLQWFESDISPDIRFMTDFGITPSAWCTVQGTVVEKSNIRSDHHFKIDLEKGGSITARPEIIVNSPISTLCWDIECICMEPGVERFPTSSKDPVITIGCIVSIYGKPELTTKTVFQLGTCDAIEGTTVVSCQTEAQLLNEFSKFFARTGPDILSGYNSDMFDFVYVFERCEKLKIGAFKKISIEPKFQVFFQKRVFQSMQSGSIETIIIHIPGTVCFDLLPLCRKNYKLRSYKLNNVAKHFLADQEKDDMPYNLLAPYMRKDSKHRALIAKYCVQDVALVQLLTDKLKLLVNQMSMSKTCNVSLSDILTRGQSHKCKTLFLKYTAKNGFLLPVFPRDPASGHTKCTWHNGVVNTKNTETSVGGAGFKGATVLEPVKGLHQNPCAVLDFASLYPSILRSHNLSHDTMVQSWAQVEKMGLKKEDVTETPNGFLFVNSSVHEGIVPMICRELLAARKVAKRMMKEAPNEFERSVWDGQQLSLKVSCNSVYGFCGASVGSFPAQNIASSVTAVGREMIDQTADFGRKHYQATVLYGDTDSVFLTFPPVEGETPLEARQRTLKLAQDMEEKINGDDGPFRKPNFLEYEKTFAPFFLLGKKRYCATKYEFDMENGKQSFSGLEIVRRDNCPLLKTIQTDFFDRLLKHDDPIGAATSLLNHIKALMSGKVSLENLTISKNLSKLKYAGNQIHVSLNERIRARTPALAYSVGSRIPYVVVTGRGQLYERGEDPTFVRENCIPIDRSYYFEKQIKGPMQRLLIPLFGNANTRLFFERAQQGAMHSFMASDKEDWIPPLLGDRKDKPKGKKRKAETQKNTLDGFFKKKK